MIEPKLSNPDSLYSVIAKFYDLGLWIFGYKLAVGYFVGLLPFKKNDYLKVLDAGCGTGLYTFALLRRFPNAQVWAFDLNTNMIEVMKNAVEERGLDNQVKIFTGDITKKLPLRHEQFDLIITGGVLEYVDVELTVKNLSPYLKKGGYFLNSPVKDNLLARIVGKLYRFKPHSRMTNIGTFTKNGFSLNGERSFPIIKEAHLFQKYDTN